MNWDEIKENVRKEYTSINPTCECGGVLMCEGQALCYSEEDKTMIDLIMHKCATCGKQKDFKIPVKSAYGQAMAGVMQKMEDLKAKGLSMYSGHTVLEGNSTDENGKFDQEREFTLKCQCYKCNHIFEFHHTKTNWRCACPKCDAS